MSINLIVILGPTASGKTNVAARLAFDLGGEIISADSRQVYRGMNIGTGKDLNQYMIDGRQVPYHLIDIIAPDEEFNLFAFQKRFYEIFTALVKKNILPVLVGGTGLYLESVLLAYDLPEAPVDKKQRNALRQRTKSELQDMLLDLHPRLHNRTDLEDPLRLLRAIEIALARNDQSAKKERPKVDAAVYGIKWERAVLRKRITDRLDERLKEGMIEEVSSLHSAGLSWERLESFGLEYRFVAQYLQKKMPFEEMKDNLTIAIHQFAKRQETWFRRMERNGVPIHWLPGDDYPLLKENVIRRLR
ncbi:MAG: tRNA (adenosine(37)-N6)-dimethylallyltransferase MiaA [Smithella sp.]|nr:tRNA (adenosine(37)-N6)-dimethylallyltransferase MiaA [Smithella sp.]